MPASRAGRALAAFWIVIAGGTAIGAGVLQWLGPPVPAFVAAPKLAQLPPSSPVAQPARQSTPSPFAPPKPGQPIHGPLDALLELPASLPRVAPDGLAPMRAYAAGVSPGESRPRIALLFGGIGLSERDSEDALHALPSAVSFAVSAYAAKPEHLLDDIRAGGHEFLLALPMEPRNYPADDPGNQALLVDAPPGQNAKRLDWSLSRFAGYAGVTNAADNGMRGEHFAASPLIGGVLRDLARRGLFYIGADAARPPEAPPAMVARGIDLVLDEPAVRTEIDAKLAKLESLARERGAVIGLATMPRPVTIDRIATWTAGLSQRGIALVPVSAVAALPASRIQ